MNDSMEALYRYAQDWLVRPLLLLLHKQAMFRAGFQIAMELSK